MNGQEIYRTVDLYVAAFLKAKGITLVDVEREDKRVTFLFKDPDEVERLVKDFYNGGQVRANDYRNALRDLKAIIYRDV